MTNRRVFVLGVGAQKAGTSWLFHYVNNDPRANLVDKEYHIWDAVYSDLCKEFRVETYSLLKFRKKDYARFAMQRFPLVYEYFFRCIFFMGAEITGDITPSYAVLSTQQLAVLKKKIRSTGADIKVVFLMRDPVERCWSAARMMRRNSEEDFDDVEFLANAYTTEEFQFRTRYEVVCRNLLATFEREELYFGIYETMFDDEEIERLSSFIGIAPRLEMRSERFNRSRKRQTLPASLLQDIRSFYSDTYDYCFEAFPQTRDLWSS